MTTNCIKFTSADIETAKGVGSISTLTFDLDITVEPVASTNPMAPTHRVLGRSPRRSPPPAPSPRRRPCHQGAYAARVGERVGLMNFETSNFASCFSEAHYT